MIKFIIGLIATVALIVLIIFLILSGNGGNSQNPSASINLRQHMTDPGTRVQLYISGPIVSEDKHRELEIDVTNTEVSMTTYRGYQRQIIETKSYPNNNNAFGQFLSGLQRAGFTKGETGQNGDERGYCVSGSRDVYTYTQNGNQQFRFWSTTCGQGTFEGNIGSTTWLFKRQVPDYDKLVNNADFYGY